MHGTSAPHNSNNNNKKGAGIYLPRFETEHAACLHRVGPLSPPTQSPPLCAHTPKRKTPRSPVRRGKAYPSTRPQKTTFSRRPAPSQAGPGPRETLLPRLRQDTTTWRNSKALGCRFPPNAPQPRLSQASGGTLVGRVTPTPTCARANRSGAWALFTRPALLLEGENETREGQVGWPLLVLRQF